MTGRLDVVTGGQMDVLVKREGSTVMVSFVLPPDQEAKAVKVERIVNRQLAVGYLFYQGAPDGPPERLP